MNVRISGIRNRGKKMKKLFMIFLVMTVLTAAIFPEDTDTLLRIPVRAAAEKGFEKDLEKKDFKLFINGEPREIVEFFPKSRSIAAAKSKRNFILAFDITGGSDSITSAISHFADHILTGGDNLFIWSPAGKIYRVDSDSDKKKIVDHIEKIIKDDSAAYKTDMEAIKDKLENMARMVILEPVSIKYFISAYARLYIDFKNRFLVPDLNSYNQLASHLAGEAEEKWMINFREGQVFPSLPHFQAAKEKIRRYTAGMKKKQADTAAAINNGLDAIEKNMIAAKRYPMDTILNFMLGLNLNYNIILIESNESKPENGGSAQGQEDIFKGLARKTGGIFISGSDPAAALDAVSKNIDYYYEVVFKFNGKLEDKDIKVEVAKPGLTVFYRNRFLEQEIKVLDEMLNETGIEIRDYSLKGYNLKFKISGFKIGKSKVTSGKKTGIVQITIKLINDKNEVIYKTGRALKSRENAIDISLNLPAKFTGYFKLTIAAIDLISSRNAKIDKYIKLQ